MGFRRMEEKIQEIDLKSRRQKKVRKNRTKEKQKDKKKNNKK